MDYLIYIIVAALALVVIGYFLVSRGKAKDEPAPKSEGNKERPSTSEASTARERESGPAESSTTETDDSPPPVEAETGADAKSVPPPPPRASKQPSRVPPPDPELQLSALQKGLKTTRGGFVAKLGKLLRGKKEIDSDVLDEIEEVLLSADVGVQFTEKLKDELGKKLSKDELADSDAVWDAMGAIARDVLSPNCPEWDVEQKKPFVIMVIGVNGVGKTTTIAKLASKYTKAGLKVVLAAGDTFRAAAVRQLEMWGSRVGAEIYKDEKPGADPASVCFGAIERAIEVDADVVIADTAGRLHTKAPLMDEIKKVRRVMDKALDGAPHEVLLVLDANTGQNANQQARQFKEALDVTGLVLTKLDGTAKGGVILGVCAEHEIPVRFIGVGERDDDLREFDSEEFVSVLFGRLEDGEVSAA